VIEKHGSAERSNLIIRMSRNAKWSHHIFKVAPYAISDQKNRLSVVSSAIYGTDRMLIRGEKGKRSGMQPVFSLFIFVPSLRVCGYPCVGQSGTIRSGVDIISGRNKILI
jgi:hypothetical protein